MNVQLKNIGQYYCNGVDTFDFSTGIAAFVFVVWCYYDDNEKMY
jgi:hypothetical protein